VIIKICSYLCEEELGKGASGHYMSTAADWSICIMW